MKTFVVRARAASVDSRALMAQVGTEGHSEILAHTLMNAFFVAQSHRDDVVVHLVLERTRDYSRTITFNGSELGQLGGFHESALLGQVAHALDASVGMTKESQRPVAPGITVRTLSFEKLLLELAPCCDLFVMDRKGTPIEEQPFAGHPCFILTDHVPMPRKSLAGLRRLGAQALSLGPGMLFASQCVVLIHHYLDRSS